MSQNITRDYDDIEDFRTTSGAEKRTQNVSESDHPLKSTIGESEEEKERNLDVTIGAKRLIDLYESQDVFIREMVANSETACINRARIELDEAGYDVPDTPTEILSKAKEKVGYEGQIDIIYHRKPEATTFELHDNGVGISSEQYKLVQNIGYSGNYFDGSVSGNFGVGWLSTFLACGTDGSFEMVTRSAVTGESYGCIEYVANTEYLSKERDSVGTSFYIPAFCSKAQSVNVASAVEKYSKATRVTTVYREFDQSGEETDASEEYQPMRLEERYDDDSLIVSFSNEFFKVVMSPEKKDDLKTYNISMPINRNVDRGYADTHKFSAKWAHDVRTKREDGPIVKCESDESLVGRVPIEDTKYDKKVAEQTGFVGVHMTTADIGETVDSAEHEGKEVLGRGGFRSLDCEASEQYIAYSELPDDAISMPKPASSRDSFESGHDDFWRHVSIRVMDAWREVAAARFEALDSWQDFLDMSGEEQEELVRAYNQFGPSYGTNAPSNVQDELEDQFDTHVPTDTCRKLDNLKRSYLVVEEGCDRPDLKSNTDSTNVRKLLRNYDRVFMSKTVNPKKAHLAWGLPEDTAVVRLDGETYQKLEELWGFEKLKSLPSRNIREKLPSVDDDVLDEWADKSVDDVSTSSSNSGGGKKGLGSKKVTVRTAKRKPRYMNRIRASTLKQKLENEEQFSTGRFNRSCEWLILKKQTETNGVPRTADCSYKTAGGIATAAVPNYVYEALIDTPRAFDSYAEVRHAIEQQHIEAVDTAENVIFTTTSMTDYFGGDNELLEAIGEWTDYSFDADSTDVHTAWESKFIDSADLSADTYGIKTSTCLAGEYIEMPMDEIRAAEHLPDCIDDYHSDEFYAYFGTGIKGLDFDTKQFEVRKQTVIEAGGIPDLN